MVRLDPKEEANLIAYIVLYDLCKEKCRTTIGETLKKYGKATRKVVYRGHSKGATRILRKGYSFLSTSPSKAMGELFVERNWDKPQAKQRVGHLFTIHLMDVPTLSTKAIDYTLSPEVIEELSRIVKTRTIEKGLGSYTFKQFAPKLKGALQDLIFDKKAKEEILVPTTGVFFKDANKTEKGFQSLPNGNYETWYWPA